MSKYRKKMLQPTNLFELFIFLNSLNQLKIIVISNLQSLGILNILLKNRQLFGISEQLIPILFSF